MRLFLNTIDYTPKTAYTRQDIQFASHLTYFFIDCYKKNHQSTRISRSGYVRILPLLLLFLLVTTTVLIAVRIQRERVGELRQFASGGAYATPVPAAGGVTPSVTIKPSVTVTQAPSSTTSEQPKGGYTLDMILNPDANTAAGRTGYNCAKGGCPEGVEVSGFYKAPNGRYYPVASASGPSSKDLAYVYKKVDEKIYQYAALKDKLATCTGSSCTSIQNQMNQLKSDLGYTTAKLDALLQPVQVDEKKVKALEQYQTLVTKYQNCTTTSSITSTACVQMLLAAQQFASANGLSADERAAIDKYVKVNSIINAYVDAGLKLAECQSEGLTTCGQYSATMKSLLNNISLTADDIKLAKESLAQNTKISNLLNSGVTNGLTPTQIINNLVNQAGLSQADAQKMVSQATLSMATNVMKALDSTAPGGEVAIYAQLFPKEKSSACAKDISCVQRKLQEYIHTNAPSLDAQYASTISDLNLSRELAQAKTDTTGYAAAQLLAKLKTQYKTELSKTTNLDQAIAILNKTLPSHLQTSAVSASDIEATIRQATGQSAPKTSLQNAYDIFKSQHTTPGVRLTPDKEKALQKQFEDEQLAALGRLRSELEANNTYNETLAKFYKGELIPTELEDKLHPLTTNSYAARYAAPGTVVPKTRTGYSLLNSAVNGIEKALDKVFGLSASEAKNEAQGAIDLYGLNVTPSSQAQLEVFYKNKSVLEAAGYFRANEESETALIKQIAAGSVKVDTLVDDLGTVGKIRNTAWSAVSSIGNGFITQRINPTATNKQEQLTAQIYVQNTVMTDPTYVTTITEKIKTDPATKKAYETYQQTAPADKKNLEGFLVNQYQTALDVQDKATAKMYDAPALQQLFNGAGAEDTSWLRRAALEGTVDMQELSVKLAAAKKVSTQAENALSTEQYRRGNSAANIAKAATVVHQANYTQAEILAEAYIKSIPKDNLTTVQTNLQANLKAKNISIPVEEYQKQQLATYLNDEDVQFLMGSGGVNITMQGALDGTYDMKRATEALASIKANDPLAAAALSLNKFEEGSLLKGQLIRDDPNASWYDRNIRAPVMMTAKPALTAVAIIVPPLRIAQLAGTAMTAQTALAIAGDAMGVYMTGTSLQQTAIDCDALTAACVKSAGMTLFAASSAISSASQLNTLARAARVTRLEQGIATGIDTADIAWSATAGKAMLKNPVTKLFVNQGDIAIADLATLTSQAGKVPLTLEQLTAEQVRVSTALGRTVYSGATESLGVQYARNGLGTLVFGSQAVDACSQAVDANCLTSIGLAAVSFGRLTTAHITAAAPQSASAIALNRADQLVNISQAGVACTAAALGEASKESCMTNIMFAGLSAGQAAIRESNAAAPLMDDPFTQRTQALSDAALLGNAALDSTILFNGKQVQVTSEARTGLVADVQARLAQATSGVAQIIGQTNQLISAHAKDTEGQDPAQESAANRTLTKAIDTWKALVNPDGTVKEFLTIEGPAEANGEAPKIAITDAMVENAHNAITASQRQIALENQLKADPKRSAVEKLGDGVVKLFGGDVKVISDFETARATFVEAAKTADSNPLAYEVAAKSLEKAKTAVERSSLTAAQQKYAQQVDLAKEELLKTQQSAELIKIRMELLQAPDRIEESLASQLRTVRGASNDLVRAMAEQSSETVIAAAREKLARAEEVYRTVQATKDINDTITGEGMRTTMIADENSKLGPFVQSEININQRIAILEQSVIASGTMRGRLAEFATSISSGKANPITEWLQGKSVRETALEARYTRAVAAHKLAEAENLKRTLVDEGKPVPSSVEKSITDLTVQFHDAEAAYDAAKTRADNSWFAKRGRSLADITIAQENIVDTLGELKVVSDDIRKEGLKVIRKADNTLAFVDASNTEVTSAKGKAQLEKVSQYLDKLETNWTDINGKNGRELRMAGPDNAQGRADQSGIFYDALFDTQIDPASDVMGVLYNGSTGLGKSSFLLNAIADAKVSLTGSKVHVMATAWGDVEGMMRQYAPEVHSRNGVKAAYFNMTTREVTYFDGPVGGVCACGIATVRGEEAARVLREADIVYSATVETPYEFHASRADDPLTIAFKAATKNATLLIDEFDVIAAGTRFSSGGQLQDLVSQKNPELTQKYRTMYQSDAVRNFVDAAVLTKTGKSSLELFTRTADGYALANTEVAQSMYRDMINEAARQAFDATKGTSTQTFDEFLTANKITVDDTGNLRTNSKDIVAAYDAFYKSGDTPSAFKSEFGDRIGAMNAMIDHASKSTNGYGFDTRGNLVYGDGGGRLQNTRPQEVLSALALDTVGYRIQKAVLGEQLNHENVTSRIDGVTVTNQGETSTWKQILSSGHYAQRLYGFTGTPDSVVLDAKLSLGMTLKTPDPDGTSKNMIFGDTPVRAMEWHKVSALTGMKVDTLGEGQAARIVIDIKETSRELVLEHILSEARAMGSDVEVVLVNNDNNVAENKKVQVYKDGKFVSSIEGDTSGTAIEKFADQYAFKNRGNKRFILVYDQGSGRGTDIQGVFETHESTINGRKYITSTDPEYIFGSEATGTTTDVTQDIGRAREIAEKARTYLLSDADAVIDRVQALDILEANEAVSTRNALTGALRQGYDDMVKNSIDILNEISAKSNKGKAVTIQYQNKDISLGESLKLQYDKVAGINDSLTQSSQTGVEAIDKAASRAREFINGLVSTPEFAKLSLEAREYYFENMYNEGPRVAIALPDAITVESRASLQNIMNVDARTALINENIALSEVADTVSRQGRETATRSTQEQIDAITKAAAPKMDAYGERVAAETIKQAKALTERATTGTKLSTTNLYRLSLARATVSKLESSLSQAEKLKETLESVIALSPQNTQQQQAQLQQVNTNIAQINTSLSELGVTGRDMQRAARNDAATRLIGALEKRGVPDIRESVVGTPAYESAISAMLAYETAAAQATSVLSASSLAGNPEATIVEATQDEKKALDKAIAALLVAAAPDTEYGKQINDVSLIRAAEVGSDVTLSTGVTHIFSQAQKDTLLSLQEKQIQAIVTGVTGTSEGSFVKDGIAYQKSRVDRLVAQVRFIQGLSAFWTQISKAPRAYVQATRLSNVVAWLRNLFVRAPSTGKITVAKTPMEAALLGISNGRYADAYVMLETARTRSGRIDAAVSDAERLEKAIRESIANRLSQAVGRAVDANDPVVTAIMAYESGFVLASAAWDGSLDTVNTTALFTAEINGIPTVASLRDNAIASVRDFRELNLVENDRIAAATVDMVSRPMADSTYILIRSEDGRSAPPSGNAGNGTGGNGGGTTGGGSGAGGQQISTQTQIVLRALQSPITARVTAAQTIAAAGGYDAVYRALAEVELAKRTTDIAAIQAVLGTDIRDRIAAATGKTVKQPEGDDMVAEFRKYEQRQRTGQVRQQAQTTAAPTSRAPQVIAGALTTVAVVGVAGAIGLQMVAQNIGPRSPPPNTPNATVQAPPDFVYTSPFNTAVGAIDDITYRGAPSGSIEQNVPVSNQVTSQIESTDFTKYLTNASRDIATVAREELGLNEVRGDGICGPLAAQMMIDAGQLVLDASNLPNGDANPAAAIRQKFDRLNLAGGNLDDGWFLNQVMPESKFTHVTISKGQSLLSYLEANPLPAGTFIYMRGVTSDTNGYVAHMVRTSVDADGRMTAVMNVQENDGTWVIKEVDLLDTLSLWQTPSGNLYRNSGMNGAEIFTPKEAVPMKDVITIETATVNEVASIEPVAFSNQQVVRSSADISFSALQDVTDPGLQRQAIVYGVLQDFLDLQKTDAGKEEIRRVINAQPQSRNHKPAFAVPGEAYRKEPAQTLQFYVQARFASDLSLTGMDFIHDPSLVAALQVLTGQFGLPRGGIVQPYQCLGVAAMMDALVAPSAAVTIADMPVTDAAGIFELFGLGRDQVEGGKTWNNAFVTVEAQSVADLQDGDFIVFGNHIVPILKVYESQFGTIVVFDQGNSPKTGTPTLGLLDFMVVDSNGFQKEIGDIRSVLVVRRIGFTATAQHEQAPQSILSLLTTNQDVANTGEGAQTSSVVGGLAGLARVFTGGNAGTGPDDSVVVTVPSTGVSVGTPAEVMQKIIVAYYQLHDPSVLNKFYSGADENTVLDDASLGYAADNIIHDVSVLADRLPPDDGLVQLQRALARRDYMQAYRAYIGLQADASAHPIAFNDAIEAFHRDIAQRLSEQLGVTVAWNNAAISRIAEYELSVLAFTNRAAQDPRITDYQAYFDAAHADPTITAALDQARAVYDALAAPLGITSDAYADGLRRTIDPMMTSVWAEMKLDDVIAARANADLASQTGFMGSLRFGLSQGYRYTFGANPFKIFNSKLPSAERFGEPSVWFAFRIAPLLTGNPIAILTSTVFWAWDAVRLVTAPAQYVWAHWVHPETAAVVVQTASIVPADAGIPATGLRRRIYESNIFTNGLTRQEIGKRLPMYLLTRGLLLGSTFLGGWTGPIAGYVFYQDMTFALPAQTRINIANGSREGFFEDMWNAHPFFGIGHKPWKPIYIIRDPFIFFGRYTIPVAGQLLILRDTWRAVSWPFRMIGRIISTPAAPAYPTVNPNPSTYFDTDGDIKVLGFTIPRSWINATPNGNFWPFVLTRFTPISGLLNGYDWHRFIDEGGWQWMFAQQANHWSRQHSDSNSALNFLFKYFVNPRPFVGGWGETIGYIVSRSSVVGTPGLLYDGFRAIRWVREQVYHGDIPGAVQQQNISVVPVTNATVGLLQSTTASPIANSAPTTAQSQQTAVTTTHVFNGVATGGARGVTRYIASRTWFTFGQLFVPWYVRLPIIFGSDAIQYVWNRVNPASYQRALTSIASYPILQGFADILSIPAGRGADAWQSYILSRGMFIAPGWLNGLLFTVNDIVRAREWAIQRGRVHQAQADVQMSQSTVPVQPAVADLSGFTFTDIIVPDGTVISTGLSVTARYTDPNGNSVKVPARIRGAALSRGSWSVSVDGVNVPVVVREAKFIPQSVAEPSPAYIALNNLVADLTSPMTAQQRIQELTDDVGAIGEIIGQTPTQIINAFTQEAEQARTNALLVEVRERERQLNELRALEESQQTAEFLARNAAYQAETWSVKHILPVVAESITTGVIPSFEAWMDSRAMWRRMTLVRAMRNQQIARSNTVTLFENPDTIRGRLEDATVEIVGDGNLRSLVEANATQDDIVHRIEVVLQDQNITRTDFRFAGVDYEVWLNETISIARDMFTTKRLSLYDRVPDTSRPSLITDAVSGLGIEESAGALQSVWVNTIFSSYEQFIPEEIRGVWEYLRTADPIVFNRGLGLGLSPESIPLSALRSLLIGQGPMSDGLRAILSVEDIDFLEQLGNDLIRSAQQENEFINKEQQRGPDELLTRVPEVRTIGDIYSAIDMRAIHDELNGERGKPVFLEHSTEYKARVLAIYTALADASLRTPSIFESLAIVNLQKLPSDYVRILEDYFYQVYGQHDLGVTLSPSMGRYIIADSDNPLGRISRAQQLEQQTLEEYGFEAGTGMDEYIQFLRNISAALEKQPDGFVITIGSRRFAIKYGALTGNYVHHYSQQDPFTYAIPEQERANIGISELLDDGTEISVAIIPSTWRTLVEQYGFFEYGGGYTFGPRRVLPRIIQTTDLGGRHDAFVDLASQIEHLAVPLQAEGVLPQQSFDDASVPGEVVEVVAQSISPIPLERYNFRPADYTSTDGVSGVISIGSDTSSTIVLDYPGTISGLHARMYHNGSSWMLSPGRGFFNNLQIKRNGQNIQVNEAVELQAGDSVNLYSDFQYTVEIGARGELTITFNKIANREPVSEFERITTRLLNEGKIDDQDIVYKTLGEELSLQAVEDKVTGDYGNEIGMRVLDMVRRELGDEYIRVLVEPSVSSRAEAFVAYALTQRGTNGALPTPWQLRERFKTHLGKTRVYRAVMLTEKERAFIEENGFVASLLRVNSSEELNARDDRDTLLSESLKKTANMVHSHVRGSTRNSALISVSVDPMVAAYAATNYGKPEEIEEDMKKSGRKLYIYPMDMDAFYLITYDQEKIIKSSGGGDFIYNDTRVASQGIEQFVQLHIPSTYIDDAEVFEQDIFTVPTVTQEIFVRAAVDYGARARNIWILSPDEAAAAAEEDRYGVISSTTKTGSLVFEKNRTTSVADPHAQVVFDATRGVWVFKALKNKQSTRVNDARMTSRSRFADTIDLHDGDVIKLGSDVVIEVHTRPNNMLALFLRQVGSDQVNSNVKYSNPGSAEQVQTESSDESARISITQTISEPPSVSESIQTKAELPKISITQTTPEIGVDDLQVSQAQHNPAAINGNDVAQEYIRSPDKLPTRDLTDDEVWSIVQENPEIRALDSQETRRLVKTYIHGVQIGGVNTLVISQEYDAKLHIEPLDAIIFALIRDQRSKAPMIEYFSPEIIKNAENIPLIGGWFARQFKKQEQDPSGGYVKAKYFDELADIAAKDGKDVVVGDIANRIRYYTSPVVWTVGSSLIPWFINPVWGVINGMYYAISDVFRFFADSGQYDRTTMHWYEIFDIHQDDGRRMYVAQSLRQLAVENQPRNIGSIQDLPIQLVVYPPAHALRISRYLHPKNQVERAMRNIKLLLYRASGVLGLDFSIRQFHRNEASGVWDSAGERSIAIFYSPQGTFEDPEIPRSWQEHLQGVHTPILGPLYRFIVRRSAVPVFRLVNFIRDFRYLGGNGAVLWAIDQAQDSLFRTENGIFVDSSIARLSSVILSNSDEAARLDALDTLRGIVHPRLMEAALAARGEYTEVDVQRLVSRMIDRNFSDIRSAALYIRRRVTAREVSQPAVSRTDISQQAEPDQPITQKQDSDADDSIDPEGLPRVSIVQTTLDVPVVGEPVIQMPSDNPIHALWLTQSAITAERKTLQDIDEYVQRIITATTVNPEDVTALDNYIEAVFRAYYIDNTLRFAYPDTVLGRYMTTLRSQLAARTTIGDSDMTALSLAFSKLMVPVLRERLLSVARDAYDGTAEMDAVAFLTQIQSQVDEVVTNYARTHLKKGLFGLGGVKYSEFENPWRNLPQTALQGNGIESRSAIIGAPVGGAVGGAWFAALWTNLPGVQYWTVQLLSQPEETWNLFRVWVTDQYASIFSNTVNVYERAILRISPEPVPACIP